MKNFLLLHSQRKQFAGSVILALPRYRPSPDAESTRAHTNRVAFQFDGRAKALTAASCYGLLHCCAAWCGCSAVADRSVRKAFLADQSTGPVGPIATHTGHCT